MGKAALAPVSYLPKVCGSSNPTYTPIANLGLNPTNHASKLLFVVPVLPARRIFKFFNFFPVPLSTTPSKIDEI